MVMRDLLLAFLAVWIVASAILSPSTGVFLTVALIGILIVLEIGEFYLPRETKESLKLSAYLLLIVFSFIVARKVYEILK
jgi:Flp pilus assembly protein TadB